MTQKWEKKPIKGVLIDTSGVLWESRTGEVVPGAIEAYERLMESGMPLRFCSNENFYQHKKFLNILFRKGFDIHPEILLCPSKPAVKLLLERNHRPYIVTGSEADPDYYSVPHYRSPYDCVLLGDGQKSYHYDQMCIAFDVLRKSDNPILYTLGTERYYYEGDMPMLDVGSYTALLEYASGVKAQVLGKPSPSYFNYCLEHLTEPAEDVVMIGDDLDVDIDGAQKCGMRAVQVKTGKYTPKDEENTDIIPDGRVKDLSEAVDRIIANWERQPDRTMAKKTMRFKPY